MLCGRVGGGTRGRREAGLRALTPNSQSSTGGFNDVSQLSRRHLGWKRLLHLPVGAVTKAAGD